MMKRYDYDGDDGEHDAADTTTKTAKPMVISFFRFAAGARFYEHPFPRVGIASQGERFAAEAAAYIIST